MSRINFLILIILASTSCKPKVTVKDLPTIQASTNKVSLRAGDLFWEKAWTISPAINPDIWYVEPKPNETIKATFITDIDSISYEVKVNEIKKFKVILNEKDTAYTQIKGVGPKAQFNSDYKRKYANKTVVEIPKLYELINIVFALTSLSSEENTHVVRKDIPHHKDVMDWFKPYKNHEAVMATDSIIRDNFNMYYALKMDTYAYKFKVDKIVSKEIYNSIAADVGELIISPELLNQLENFSKTSNFKEFYSNHSDFYNNQIAYYEKEINTTQMQTWLNKNFPKTSYDCFRVIFSPLVDWNQSAAWFDNDGFKEAQAHVNFPYPSESDKNRTDEENKLLDGQILFTEFNHAFINPEADPYFNTKQFKEAFANIDFWTIDESVAAKIYSQPQNLFNEYMNWSLVSLYYIDYAPKATLNKTIRAIEKNQTNNRGFKHFKPFNQNLITLYTNRKEGQTVADLYPEIMAWCHEFATQEQMK